MASVIQPRQKSTASRFSWLSKLYKRTAAQNNTPASRSSAGGRATQSSTPASSVHGAPFLSLQQSGDSQEALSTDASSLRPTISTRAPSVSSNAAVLNVEVPGQPHESRLSRAQSGLSLSNHTHAEDLGESEFGQEKTPIEGRISQDEDMLDTPRLGKDDDGFPDADDGRLPSPLTSTHSSSKDSPIPSIFTGRTVETQPTQLHPAPASLLSARGIMGTGAADNASMLTLASSSKARRRRRSIDTQASMRALAPGSARNSFESGHTQPSAANVLPGMAGMGDSSATGPRTSTSLAGSLYNYRSMLSREQEETRDSERLSTGQRSMSGYSLQLPSHEPQHAPPNATQPALARTSSTGIEGTEKQ